MVGVVSLDASAVPEAMPTRIVLSLVGSSSGAESAPEAVHRAEVTLTPVGFLSARSGPLPAAVSREVRIPSELEWQLDSNVVWSARVEGEGLWAPETVLGLGGSEAVQVWRTGTVRARLHGLAERDTLSPLTLRFESSPGSNTPYPVPRTTVACFLDQVTVHCEVPAGVLDLRLRAKGYVSFFRWSETVAAGRVTDLGRLVLKAGASVAGTVATAAGPASPTECRVTLAPQSAGGAPSVAEESRRQSMLLTEHPDERGFFHFEGLDAGSYVLTASQPGFAEETYFPLTVPLDAEVEIQDPIVLEPPLTLSVVLSPPVAPGGDPWRIGLYRKVPVSGLLEQVEAGEADLAGNFESSGLVKGGYAIEVRTPEGAAFAWHEVDLDSTTGSIQLELDAVWVEGIVTLGADPLPAHLSFGGRRGAVRVPMESDREGVFAGVLPRQGTWEVYLENEELDLRRNVMVEVDAQRGSGVAELEIELPDTRITGTVEDRSGRPVQAIVQLTETTTGEAVFHRAGEDGSFTFRGMAEGMVAIQASTGPGHGSNALLLRIDEDRDLPPVRLVLDEWAELTGTVVSRAGPVPGASVFAVPVFVSPRWLSMPIPETVTDVTGRFALALPEEPVGLRLVVLPPGYALTTVALDHPWQGPIEIAVEELGGDLVLRWPEERALGPRTPQPVVFRGDTRLDQAILGQWLWIKQHRASDTKSMTIPDLPSGHYDVCWTSAERLARVALRGGSEVESPNLCRSGWLAPHGSLEIELTAPR